MECVLGCYRTTTKNKHLTSSKFSYCSNSIEPAARLTMEPATRLAMETSYKNSHWANSKKYHGTDTNHRTNPKITKINIVKIDHGPW
ncbi:hypothetical protein XELAEV_18008505mg [Xenopus laevis]|uniref:Uncharacterized protein n=1 Tax=Xenopus laevis TaxID=8355 RepID=A0A974I6B1_XENLA|nr:hypothetical protein XELAEV_18008505mg [Xenopus laevis]